MAFGYDRIVLPALRAGAKFGSLFNAKLRSGFAGRENLNGVVTKHYASVSIDRKRILIHVASFGELEQAKPVIEALRNKIPSLHIHLTFFSPSGFENAKGKYETPDLITYAPFDFHEEVRSFLDLVKPDLALFARYDLWPNMADALRSRNIPSILFSATFDPKRENSAVRKLHVATYNALELILTISEKDKVGFERLGVTRPKIVAAGDTRFDQVLQRRANIENAGQTTLPEKVRKKVLEDSPFVFVAGSTWHSDEAILKRYLKKAIERRDNLLALIVQHEPTEQHVSSLMKQYPGEAIRLSDCENYCGERIIVVDSIGKLFGLYRDASAAYVGGGFSAGVHNVLEPAVWGVPVLIGPRNRRSQEVASLIAAHGGYEAGDSREFEFLLWRFVSDTEFRKQASCLASEFVQSGSGATARIMSAILPHVA